MVSHAELGSDPPIGSNQESGRDMEAGSGDTKVGKDMICKGGDVGDNGGMTCGAEVSTDV